MRLTKDIIADNPNFVNRHALGLYKLRITKLLSS